MTHVTLVSFRPDGARSSLDTRVTFVSCRPLFTGSPIFAVRPVGAVTNPLFTLVPLLAVQPRGTRPTHITFITPQTFGPNWSLNPRQAADSSWSWDALQTRWTLAALTGDGTCASLSLGPLCTSRTN